MTCATSSAAKPCASRSASNPSIARCALRTAPVLIPFAEGPIDVDRQVDWDLANRIIAEREQGQPERSHHTPPPFGGG